MHFLRNTRCEGLDRGCQMIQQAEEFDLAFKVSEGKEEAPKVVAFIEKLMNNGGRGRMLLEAMSNNSLKFQLMRLAEAYPDRLQINLLNEGMVLSYYVLLVNNSKDARVIIGLEHLSRLEAAYNNSISIELPLTETAKGYIKNHLNELNKYGSPIIKRYGE